MVLTIVFLCIILLVAPITWLKINPFLVFLFVSIVAGLSLGLPVGKIPFSLQKGMGEILGGLVMIICCGAMMGKLVAESGAAQKIASVLMNRGGRKYVLWAMLLTGFIVGIPLFYAVGFVLLMPLVFSIAYQYKMPAVQIAMPLLAALSVAQGYLPPHPSPSALMVQFGAGMGKTFFYGVIIAIPAMIVGGILFANTVKRIRGVNHDMFTPGPQHNKQLPGALNAFLSALLPVVLLVLAMGITYIFPGSEKVRQASIFLSDPSILMLLSLAIATFSLGRFLRKRVMEIMELYAGAVKDIAMILMIMGAAGALKQVLIDSNVSDIIAVKLAPLSLNPLILGWLIAATVRICLGSATIAGLTTAGIIAPTVMNSNVDPSLMVLAIGSGSLMCSHVNDPAFWMFKEYLGLSFRDTVLSWSLLESIVALVGLGGVLLLNQVV